MMDFGLYLIVAEAPIMISMTATVETALEGLTALNASTSERRLVEMLGRHVDEEDRLLQDYLELAGEGSSDAVRYLARMIMTDEARHHRQIVELANTIAWTAAIEAPVTTVPDLPVRPARDRALAARTRALLTAEERDRDELKRLAKELKPFADTTMWPLLVELMTFDTEKHIRILRFIDKHVVRF